MAVSIQTPLPSKPGMWNLGESPAVYSTSGTNAAPSSMAYQYPLPTSNFEPSSNLIPSFQHPPSDNGQHNHSSTAEPPTPTGSNHPGSSVGSKAAKIKRSMSTPNVRGQATAEAAALALSADKRRNKLGYHRTSVACGHCRRRKIRCIPAPADPQNRCSNCIRLKKECNFYPVDQQPQPDPRRRGSKSQSGTGRASESTSPTTSSGQLPEMSTSLPYPPLNMPPIQDLGGPQMKRQRTESFSPDNKVVTSSRNFEFNHGPTNWMAPDASPGIKHQGDTPQSFWRPNAQDSPLTPAFSPFTPSLQIPPSQNWPTPHTEPSPRDDLNWSVPQRSISYSNIEGLHHPQHQQYAPSYTQSPTTTVPENYTTKPPRVQHPGMYPPPTLSSSTSSMMAPTTSATTNEPPPHPHSANSLPPTAFSNWPQPYYQKPVGSSSEAYGSWNAHHEAHPRPVPSQYSNDAHPPAPAPAPAYGYPEHQGQMYYQGPPHPGHPGR